MQIIDYVDLKLRNFGPIFVILQICKRSFKLIRLGLLWF